MIDVAQFTSTESVYVRFSEDNKSDMLALWLITERYQGIEAPIMVFSRDGVRTLVVPRSIKKVFPNADKISASETSPVRLPNGEGAINGDC